MLERIFELMNLRNRDKTKKKLMEKLEVLRNMLDELHESIVEFQKAEERLKEEIIEYEKLSAIGRLTANVAHEIRNPITVIGGLSKRLTNMLSDDLKAKQYLESIHAEAKRLEEVLKDVLFFSDKTKLNRENQDINNVIIESLELYEDICNSRSIVIRKIFGEIPKIYFDKKQIKAVMENLISNAIDAMPEGGALTVTTKVDSVKGKNYVVVMIEDTGSGISEDEIGMIFEPFFTTKMTGKETGLGLSIAKKIIEGHGGLIQVNSAIGKGSIFKLYFPYRSIKKE